MFVCRLYHHARPLEPLEARDLAEGRLTLGRDAGCDWVLPASDDALSRSHCALYVEAGRLMLRDASTNGTFLDDGERAPRGQAIELKSGARLRLGAHILLIERLASIAPTAPATPATGVDASLLDAFFEGAGLDASAFAGEEPEELMRRVGAIYLETVKGLSALMGDRARFKDAGGMTRTTISFADNNPFKWATPKRVAEALLTGSADGFLSHADAVAASFDDLHRHAIALADAAAAASRLTLEMLSPASIEAEAKGQAGLLKGRNAACWDVLSRRHAELAKTDAGVADGPGRAVVDAYRRAAG